MLLSFLHHLQNSIEILTILLFKHWRILPVILILMIRSILCHWRYFALTIGAFAIGTTEFVIVGPFHYC